MNVFSFFPPFFLLTLYIWILLFIKKEDSSFVSNGMSKEHSESSKSSLTSPYVLNRHKRQKLYFKQGWYGFQKQEGPILYASTPHLIVRYISCLEPSFKLYEGDLITLLSWSKEGCQYKRSQLPASIRLSLNLTLNVNQATVEELTLIKGVGYRKAKMILQARPYAHLGQILKLKGVGKKTLQKWRPFLSTSNDRYLGPYTHNPIHSNGDTL